MEKDAKSVSRDRRNLGNIVKTGISVTVAAALIALTVSRNYRMTQVPQINSLDSAYYNSFHSYWRDSHTKEEKFAYKSQRNLLWEQYIHNAGKHHL